MEFTALSSVAGSVSSVARGEHLLRARNFAVPANSGIAGARIPANAYLAQGGNSQPSGLALDRALRVTQQLDVGFERSSSSGKRTRAVDAVYSAHAAVEAVQDAAQLQEGSLGELTRRDFPILDQVYLC